jgi:hypothetical protein
MILQIMCILHMFQSHSGSEEVFKAMTKIRLLQELMDIEIKHWSQEELREYHYVLSDVSPWLNSQGVSLHHQLINELMARDMPSTFET